jgi:cell division protein ZapA
MTSKGAPEKAMQLDVQILGREYKVACKEHEQKDLLEAVAYLDRRMREIRDTGKVSGTDRIAVMSALNITNDLLRERRLAPPPAAEHQVDADATQRRIRSMQSTIDALMVGQEKLL